MYTARYAFPSCDSTISSTPGPSPFHGFAVGEVPPNWAIGNGQAAWLARFFVRLARRERLFSGRDAREFVADERVAADARLRGFLEHFSPQTRPFSARDPIAFVAQLAEKWDAYPYKPRATSERPAVGTPGKPPAVFLSYASQDYPAVERLRMHLDGAGLDVWFDKKRLESGDQPEYEDHCRRTRRSSP